MSKRLFEAAKHADLYAKYRPHYGKDIYERIFQFCRDAGTEFQLAVDVGCGSGQSTQPLTEVFKQVIGIDVSPKQLEHVQTLTPNVKFKVCTAEGLSTVLSPGSVDLVTMAQAMHWVDRKQFGQEVDKVLRPGGVLAVYGYGNCTVDNSQAQEIWSKFYWGTLKGYWDERRDHINNHYEGYTLPFHGWIRDDSLKIRKDWTVDQFIGYLSSSSAWQAYVTAHPTATHLEDIRQRYSALYGCSAAQDSTEHSVAEESLVHIEWPVFMLLGLKAKM